MDMEKLREELPKALIHPENGLPDEVFAYVSSLVPLINVDLLVTNDSGQILLAWRDDGYNLGWHIPGGVIRFKETFSERIQKTAQRELNSMVYVDEVPIKISEIILPHQLRGHAISLLYKCHLPTGYIVDNGNLQEHQEGYLMWHDSVPILVRGQRCYQEFLEEMWQNEYGKK